MRPRISGRFGLVVDHGDRASGRLGMPDREPEPEAISDGPAAASSRPRTSRRRAAQERDPTRRARGRSWRLTSRAWATWSSTSIAKAVEAFREVHDRRPGGFPASINLAIALLNDSGVKAEEAKKAGAEPAAEQLRRGPGSARRRPGARPGQSRTPTSAGGSSSSSKGRSRRGASALQASDRDRPQRRGRLVLAGQHLDRSRRPVRARPARSRRRSRSPSSSKALELQSLPDAGDVQAGVGLRVWPDNPRSSKELLDRWKKINPDRHGPVAGPGRHRPRRCTARWASMRRVVNPFPRPEPSAEALGGPARVSRPPSRCDVKLAEGERWVKPSDFTGSTAVIGRVRARFGAAVAAFDADGDGRLDLYLASAVVGTEGIRDVLLLNKGDGRFEDASAAFGLPKDRASLGVAAADFDADRHIDLFLTGVGDNRLLRNRDGKTFEDISSTLKPIGPPALSLMARWLDLDQDGDLDLYVVNYCAAEHADKAFTGAGEPPPGLPNAVYRNDGQPDPISGSHRCRAGRRSPRAYGERQVQRTGLSLALTPWTGGRAACRDGASPHTGIAAARHRQRPRPRPGAGRGQGAAGRHPQRPAGPVPRSCRSRASTIAERVSGLLVTDFDADGRTDLVARLRERAACSPGGTRPSGPPPKRPRSRSNPGRSTRRDGGRPRRSTWTSTAGPTCWASRPRRASRAMSSCRPGLATKGSGSRRRRSRSGLESPGLDGLTAVDLVGDPLPDILVIRPGEPPALARNLGNGQHWLALRARRPLAGQARADADQLARDRHPRARSKGRGSTSPTTTRRPTPAWASRSPRSCWAWASTSKADLVHLRWPDGVMQCELNVAANQKLNLAENNRKTGSCPVLFTWNGQRFVCIGDFLGGGGLGYLVAPGVYSQPDRDEAVAITADQLQASRRRLPALDHRADGRDRLPRSPEARRGRPPARGLVHSRRAVRAGRAPADRRAAGLADARSSRSAPTDLDGRDVTETLRHWDRRTVDDFRKRDGWIGYAEEHGIILDFGDRLSRYSAVGPARPLPGRLGRIPLLADELRGRDGRRRPPAARRSSAAATTGAGR